MSSTRNDLTPSEAQRHEFLADMVAHVAQRLVEKHSMDEEAACDVGNDLADYLASKWGKQNIYIPADEAFKLNDRDWDIFRRFQRGNAGQLAMEFGVSKVWVHAIYRRCLAAYRKRVQGGLFESHEPNGIGSAEP